MARGSTEKRAVRRLNRRIGRRGVGRPNKSLGADDPTIARSAAADRGGNYDWPLQVRAKRERAGIVELVHGDTLAVDDNDGLVIPQSVLDSLTRLNSVVVSSDYTLTADDDVIMGDATLAAFDIFLPLAEAFPGIRYYIEKADATSNAVNVQGARINGGARQKIRFANFSTTPASITIPGNAITIVSVGSTTITGYLEFFWVVV